MVMWILDQFKKGVSEHTV